MAFKLILDTVEGLAPEVAREYTKGDDGKYHISVEGMVPSGKLAEFRDNNIELKRQLERFKGVDPAKYAELAQLEQRVKESKLVDAGKIDELVAARVESMKTTHTAQLQEKDAALSVANRQLESLLIDSSVRSAANTSGVLPTAVDDLLLRAKSTFKIQDGVAVPLNDKGQIIYGSDGVNPMSIKEWIDGIAKVAPHLFVGSVGSGAPRAGAGHNTAGGNKSPLQKISSGLKR